MSNINIDELSNDELDVISRDLVWGAAEIGKVINRGERQTFYLLQSGMIPKARRIGSQWVASKRALLKFLLEGDKAGDASDGGAK